MNSVEISIVIPIYKVERYISKTIESVQNQNFDSYEIVLVDDGSPDKSGEICDRYAAKDARIKVIHKVNGGVMSARFAGVDAAQGKYVAFLDGDDRMPPTALSSFYNAMKDDVDYVIGACVDIDDEGHEIPNTLYKAAFKKIENNRAYRTHFAKHPRGMNIKMYKKAVLQANPRVVIPPQIRNNEDYIFNLFLSSKINKVVAIDDVVAEIVVREGSASQGFYSVEYWLDLFEWMDDHYDFYGVYKEDYMLYKLLTLFYRVVIADSKVDYSRRCFDNVKKERCRVSYGLKRNLAICAAKHPSRWFLNLLCFGRPRQLFYYIFKRLK